METNIYHYHPLIFIGKDKDGEIIKIPGFMDYEGVYTEDGQRLDGIFFVDPMTTDYGYEGPAVNYDGEKVDIKLIITEV